MVRSRLFTLTLLACASAPFEHRAAAETVLLDFTSPHCGPCAEMEPVLQQMEAQGHRIERVDVSRDGHLAAQYRVDVTPTYIVLIDGREWARVSGITPLATMQEMMEKSAQLAAANAPTATGPPNAAAAPQTLAAEPSQEGRVVPLTDPFAIRKPQPGEQAAGNAPGAASQESLSAEAAHLVAATVRLSVADPNGKSTGTGAIVDAHDGSALVLTCGHLFRESKGQGAVEISIFQLGANGAELRGKVAGELLDYDLERDLALVRFRTESQVDVTPIAPPGAQLVPGAPVVSVGCNHGDNPTVRTTQITAINRFQGHPNVEAAGAPVEGRSGGPLYNVQGQVIGVCFAADPQGDEGLYASLASIQAKLDSLQLTSVYTSPGTGDAVASATPPGNGFDVRGQEPTAPPTGALANQWPASGMPTPGAVAPNAAAAAPPAVAALAPVEQAALEEIARRSNGAEVICIIRPQDPNGRSDVIKLSGVSPEFVRKLAAASETAAPQTAAVAPAPGAPTASILR